MAAGPSPVEVKIEVAQLSDPGRDPNKQVNEDSCGYAQTRFGHLCVLCDGMGGHYGGQEASRRAITTIFEQFDQASSQLTPAQALKHSIEVAARRVYELGGSTDNKVRPGSTVVAMLLHDDGLDVAHVGDSRAYVIRSGQIYPLTRDHSMVQAMIDAGFITEEQAIGHPDANKITRALGMKPDVDVEVRPEPMELFAGDVLLTASDGLTDLALARDILGATRQALASGGIDHACSQLVRMANDRGGHDNITVQIVRVKETAQRKTRTGATLSGDNLASTLEQQPMHMDGPHSSQRAAAMGYGQQPNMGQQLHGHQVNQPNMGHAPMAQPGMIMGAGAAHAEVVGPTSVDRHRAETHPLQAASTAHDGTARTSFAAGSVQAAGAQGGLQLPPVPPVSVAGVAMHQQQHDAAMGPMSTRYVGQQAVQHLQGNQTVMAPMGPPRTVQPTAAMTPGPGQVASGYGAPAPSNQGWANASGPQPTPMQQQSGWPQHGAQPVAGGGAGVAPTPPSPHLAVTQNSDGGGHVVRRSDVDSMGARTGGNVLFLALAISFVVAVVILLLVWLLV